MWRVSKSSTFQSSCLLLYPRESENISFLGYFDVPFRWISNIISYQDKTMHVHGKTLWCFNKKGHVGPILYFPSWFPLRLVSLSCVDSDTKSWCVSPLMSNSLLARCVLLVRCSDCTDTPSLTPVVVPACTSYATASEL